METVFLEALESLALGKDTEIVIDGWKVRSSTVGGTCMKDLLPAEQHKRIFLLEKSTDVTHNGDDSSYHNGDASADLSENGNISISSEASGHCPDSSLLSVEDARSALSMYTMMHARMMEAKNGSLEETKLLPLWAQCDGRDPERTALIGCELVRTGSDYGSCHILPFVVTSVTCEGPLVSKSELPSVHEVICQGHGDAASKHTVSRGYALYEIVSPLSANATLAESSDSSYIAVECRWSDVKKVMETPRDADCKVLIRAVPGDIRSTPLSVYKELTSLQMFACSLETGLVSWTTREESTSVADLVSSLLDEVKQGPVYKSKATDETEGQICWQTAFDRSDLDFTERLWVILGNNASCYADIKTAFALVVNELNRGELKPMLHSRNKTIVAREIRAMYQDPTHVVSLDQSPMVLLVDIAIDKLQRDYTNFFLAQKLTTLHSLEWFVQSVDQLTPRDLVARLGSLHCILELHMVASQSLGLPTTNILTLIRTALEYYRNNPSDSQHTFVLPVEQMSVIQLYKNQLPTVWRLTTTQTRGRGEKLSSVYELSTTPHLDWYPVTAPEDVAIDSGEEQDAFQYYVTRVRRDLT